MYHQNLTTLLKDDVMNTETWSYPPYAFKVVGSSCWNFSVCFVLLCWKWIVVPMLRLAQTLTTAAFEMVSNATSRLETIILWTVFIGYLLIGSYITCVLALVVIKSLVFYLLDVITVHFG